MPAIFRARSLGDQRALADDLIEKVTFLQRWFLDDNRYQNVDSQFSEQDALKTVLGQMESKLRNARFDLVLLSLRKSPTEKGDPTIRKRLLMFEPEVDKLYDYAAEIKRGGDAAPPQFGSENDLDETNRGHEQGASKSAGSTVSGDQDAEAVDAILDDAVEFMAPRWRSLNKVWDNSAGGKFKGIPLRGRVDIYLPTATELLDECFPEMRGSSQYVYVMVLAMCALKEGSHSLEEIERVLDVNIRTEADMDHDSLRPVVETAVLYIQHNWLEFWNDTQTNIRVPLQTALGGFVDPAKKILRSHYPDLQKCPELIYYLIIAMAVENTGTHTGDEIDEAMIGLRHRDEEAIDGALDIFRKQD